MVTSSHALQLFAEGQTEQAVAAAIMSEVGRFIRRHKTRHLKTNVGTFDDRLNIVTNRIANSFRGK